MKKDKIDLLFKELEGSFETYETPAGHQKRFLEKLQSRQTQSKKISWWKPLAVAAAVAVIMLLASPFATATAPSSDLASVSPEMEQTQHFFTTTINTELETLKSYTNPEAKVLVTDALQQMDILENEYNTLKTDLSKSGNDKRVIYAMISNFQKRIDLLKLVIEKIEEIKTLKIDTNETTL